MIQRIISLENIGRFENFRHKGSTFNILSKNTVIYAENGSGKTTLSLLFKSLRGNDKLLSKKQTFGTVSAQSAKILSDGDIISYESGHWSKHIDDIETFDIHFIEDNLYTGSIAADSNKTNLFEYIIGKEGADLANKAREYQSEWDQLFKRQIGLLSPENRQRLRKSDWDRINSELSDVKKRMGILRPLIRQSNKELGEFTKQIFDTHIEEINKHLRFFTPYITIKKFSNRRRGKQHQLSYFLKVNETEVTFDLSDKKSSVKYSLSEGDKSAVSLAFFLAKVYMSTDISKKIVVFDDPLSSFDANRRNATISQLQKLSSKVQQLIVLTHDIYFARDLNSRLHPETLNLKVVRRANSSDIVAHDINKETLGGIFKDINTLVDYSKSGSDTAEKKREVIRCIRPVLEGIIRIKYFDSIRKDEWLGDFISNSRVAQPGDSFYRLKINLDDLIEVNDYSKQYHHSNPTNSDDDFINDSELKDYVDKTLRLIKEI
jgi:wobble nucleotide-excising tRNase